MFLTRQATSTKLPIRRKGTKYVARSLSHLDDSVPVVIALRDMLKLAETAREVRQIIKSGLLKINGKKVRDYRESIRLFNVLEAGKVYHLSLLPTGKFFLEETKEKDRLCKVFGKILLPKNRIQLNLHDGSNVLSSEKINIGDSVYLDSNGKIKKHSAFEKGKEAFIFSGKYIGQKGKILDLVDSKAKIKLDSKEAILDKSDLIVI